MKKYISVLALSACMFNYSFIRGSGSISVVL